MPGLIQKSGYIKPGNGGGHYAEYIATREGVELIEAPPPSHDGGGYLEYMAERPRSHGLFSADGPADLEKTMEEINGHTGPVWTFVYSLKREDAHRLGYENGESWRRLLLAHQAELATAMKIPPSNFRWCAAFHDEKHHPHIHMMVWSADPRQGYLTEKGIEKMRSQLSNEIFRDELLSLYQKKDLSYSQVRDAAMEAMGRLIREMETGLCHSSIIMEQMETLAGMLECHKGKKVYGYLPPEVKLMVDGIVDVLAADEHVAKAYDLWNEMRESICRTYSEHLPERLPLSKQKEFKPVRNMVIREALLLVQQEEGIAEEPQREADLRHVQHAAESGDPAAMCDLSDLLMKQRRSSEALYWLEQSARNGDPRGQYVLGTWYLKRGNVQNALRWLTAAADLGSSTAQYRLGVLYLKGEQVEKNLELAVRYLTASAECGNQYAQYTLGSLYRSGNGGSRDEALGREWLSRSAAQGNPYARHLLDHPDQNWTTVVQSVIRLLYHMSRIFEDNCKTDAMHRGLQIDRKRRRQFRERRLALGHKPDDHENEEIRLQ